jgi:hypothetical protein
MLELVLIKRAWLMSMSNLKWILLIFKVKILLEIK